MKRIVAVTMMVCLLLGAAALARADEGGWAVVSNPNPEDRLNLRTRPSSSATSLGKYYNGVTVTLLSGSAESGWYRVSIGPLEGYMDAGYLEVGAMTGAVTSAMPTVTIRNAGGSGANLRAGQSERSKSYGLYANGTQVTVLGVAENWLHVTTSDGGEGFIRSDLAAPRLTFAKAGAGDAGAAGDANTAVVVNPDPQDRLNLRTAASGNAATRCKYYSGVTVTLLSGEENGWYKVRVGNLEGYMKAGFLAVGGGADVAAAVCATPTVTVKTAGTRLYERMNRNSDRLATLAKGDTVTVLGVSTDYLHVRTQDGKLGFVLGANVTPEIPFDLGK